MKEYLFTTTAQAFDFFTKEIEPDESKLLYYNTVKTFLEKLVPETVITIAEITKPANIQLFMQCVSIYMTGFPDNNIVFSYDYTKLKKREQQFKRQYMPAPSIEIN